MDAFKNFAKSALASGITSGATSLSVSSGDGAKFPVVFPFNATIWNETDFSDPSDDSAVEIVTVTAISTDTLTIVRGQEGTSAVAHNTGGKTYGIVATLTALTLNAINEKSGVKTQTSVATTNLASITLSGIPDGAGGVIGIVIVSTDGTESNTYTLWRQFAITKGTSGTIGASGVSFAGTQDQINRNSAAGTFGPGTPTVGITVSGDTCTINVATSNSTGTQTAATIYFVIRDYTGHVITLL